jgi:hypothetical protein
MFLSKWDALFFPAMLAFYYNIEHTIKVKACTCFTISFFSVITTMLNYDKLYTEPDKSGHLTDFTASLVRNYIFMDLGNMFYKAYHKLEKLRKDVVVHHLLVGGGTIFTNNTIGLGYGIMGELYSCGALFGLRGKLDFLYRACVILFVRMRLWLDFLRYNYLPISYIAQTTAFYFSSMMIVLDCFWLSKIVKRLQAPRKRVQTIACENCETCKSAIATT